MADGLKQHLNFVNPLSIPDGLLRTRSGVLKPRTDHPLLTGQLLNRISTGIWLRILEVKADVTRDEVCNRQIITIMSICQWQYIIVEISRVPSDVMGYY